MENPEQTSNVDSHQRDPMHPHGVAGTPGNPGPARGGLRRLNGTEPAPDLDAATDADAKNKTPAADFSPLPDKGTQQRQPGSRH